ncbi:MAG: serine hydrolase [Arthrobacter sp.]
MEERRSQQPGHRQGGSRHGTVRSRRFRRTRAAALAVCAAALVAALGAGVHSAAQALSAPASQTATQSGSNAAASAPAAVAALPASAAATPAARARGAIDAELDAQINSILDANSEYQIGVALVDLSAGADPATSGHDYGVQAAFAAASTAKVLAAEAYYHLVETGAASLDDRLGAYTAEFQLQEMIQQSDNDSWSLIMDAVGHAELTDYAASIGVDYAADTNTLTAAEMARVLAGLYSGTLLEPGNTAQLLGYMQDTNYESLIPSAVPAGVTVFHKYGLLGGELHDAGILAKDGKAYALVIYTKAEGLGSVPQRTEVIQQLTATVADALF